jgi:hypothetical protein
MLARYDDGKRVLDTLPEDQQMKLEKMLSRASANGRMEILRVVLDLFYSYDENTVRLAVKNFNKKLIKMDGSRAVDRI